MNELLQIALPTPSKLGSNGIPKLNNQLILEDHQVQKGKTADVLFVTTPINFKDKFAVKRQFVDSPLNPNTRAYRELAIIRQLSKIEPPCPNFVTLVDWFKVRQTETGTPVKSSEATKSNDQVLYLVMDRSDTTLYHMRDNLNGIQIKSILFQLFSALHLAQTQFKFQHNDLHNRNILLHPMPEKTFQEYQIEGIPGIFYTTHYCAKICDFGLSRIQTQSGLICAPNYKVFDASVDLQTIYHDLKAIKVSWEGSSESEKKMYSNLRSQIEKLPVKNLLLHPFFKSLQKKPEGFSNCNTPSRSNEIELTPIKINPDYLKDIEALLQEADKENIDSEEILTPFKSEKRIEPLSKRRKKKQIEIPTFKIDDAS